MDVKSMDTLDPDQTKPSTQYPPTNAYQYQTPQYPYPGYPAPNPYQGYPQPYYAYPPPPPPPQATPPPHYYPPAQLPFPPPPDRRCSYAFARVVLFVVITMIIGTAVLSILTWILLGSDIPQFDIESFYVPHFKMTPSSLMAEFLTNVTVKNFNRRLDISFGHIESNLIYKESVLDSFLVSSLDVNKNEESTFHARFGLPHPGQNVSGALWFKELYDDRHDGSLTFDLRIIMSATFKHGNFWKRQTVLKVICMQLRVDFDEPTGIGTMKGESNGCLLYD